MGSMFAPNGASVSGTSLARQAGSALGSAGTGLLSSGGLNTNAGAGYYKALLGDRNQQQTAVAPAAGNISDSYAGAKAGVQAGYQQGTSRDAALGGLTLGRTRSLAGLYSGVQPAAATSLSGIGQSQLGQGIGAFQGAGSLGLGVAQVGSQLQQQQINNLMTLASGVGGLGSQGVKTYLKYAANAKNAQGAAA